MAHGDTMKVYCKCTRLRTIPGILEQDYHLMECVEVGGYDEWVCPKCGHKVRVTE